MAKNILTAKVEIQGTKPLLWDHFGEDAIPLEKGEKYGVAGNDPSQWTRSVLVLPSGQLFFTPDYMFATIREGSKHIKVKRGSIQSLVVATLQILDEVLLVDRFIPEAALKMVMTKDLSPDPLKVLPRTLTEPVYLDVRGTRNPSTKGRNVTYRVAASSGWHISSQIIWDKTVVAREQMHSALIEAGRLEGIGSGRRIGMGRFEVIRFDVSEAD